MDNKEEHNWNKEGKDKKENSLFKEIINILLSVVVAYILFILIRTFLFFPFQVSGDSMHPSLQNGERLILNRLGQVDRFDVVVFPAPDAEGEEEEYVKRIIGMPGDELVYLDNDLYIDGERVTERYLDAYKEAGKRTNDFTLLEIPGSEDTVVPEGMFFVMGDNREVSKDSRSFGFVPAEEIEGTTRLRIWPLDRIGLLEENE